LQSDINLFWDTSPRSFRITLHFNYLLIFQPVIYYLVYKIEIDIKFHHTENIASRYELKLK